MPSILKLLVANHDGKPVELLKAVEERYGGEPPVARQWHWRTEAQYEQLARGRRLAVEDRAPFTLRYGFDRWDLVNERIASRGPMGLWVVTFMPDELEPYSEINFTRRLDGTWEGIDHRVTLGHSRLVHGLKQRSSESPKG